jgi:glycosyltransferase involved in cell wall biosynthesis
MPNRLLRLLGISACIGCCLFIGFLVRWSRWFAHRPLRVTHGICPLHSLRQSVLADRSAGVRARSVVLYGRLVNTYNLTTEEEFDVVFSRSTNEATGKYWQCLCYVLLTTDIWSTSFRGFLPGKYEGANTLILRLMKAVGIKIVAFPYGGEVAWRDRIRDRFDWVGKMQLDYPDWDLEESGNSTRANVRLFCKFADIVIGMDGSLRRFLLRNDIYCKTIPVDTHALTPPARPAHNNPPLIVHAPNHRNVKGTQFLLDSLEELQRLGIPFELRLVERIHRADAIEIYRQADIIADQFVMGAYGVFALECLALGKPVLTYLDHDHLGNPVFNLPVVNTNRDNLTRVLGILLQVPELRTRLGAEGRSAVIKYQSLEAIGELNKAIYEHLWWNKPLVLENTAHFDPRRTARSFTEDPGREEFWPVEVGDLRQNIFDAMLTIQPDYVRSSGFLGDGIPGGFSRHHSYGEAGITATPSASHPPVPSIVAER